MNSEENSTGLPGDATAQKQRYEVMRLCRELSKALETAFDGQFDAVVGTADRIWLKDSKRVDPIPTPQRGFELAAHALQVAANRIDPTITGIWLGRHVGPQRDGQMIGVNFERGGDLAERAE